MQQEQQPEEIALPLRRAHTLKTLQAVCRVQSLAETLQVLILQPQNPLIARSLNPEFPLTSILAPYIPLHLKFYLKFPKP